MTYDQDVLLSGIAKVSALAGLTADEIGHLYPTVFPGVMSAEWFHDRFVVPLLGGVEGVPPHTHDYAPDTHVHDPAEHNHDGEYARWGHGHAGGFLDRRIDKVEEKLCEHAERNAGQGHGNNAHPDCVGSLRTGSAPPGDPDDGGG